MRVSNGESRGWIWKQRWKHVTLIGDIRLGPTPILPLCPAGLRKGLSLTRSIIHRIATPPPPPPPLLPPRSRRGSFATLAHAYTTRTVIDLALSASRTPNTLRARWRSPSSPYRRPSRRLCRSRSTGAETAVQAERVRGSAR